MTSQPPAESGTRQAANPQDSASANLGRHAPVGALIPIRAGLIVLNLIVLVLCCLLLWRFRLSEIEDAKRETVATAALLGRGADATFDKVRIATDYVAGQIERQLAGPGIDTTALWSIVDHAAAAAPEIDRIGVFDQRGHQVCGIPLDRCRNLDVSDRDYFAHLRAHPESATSLVGPVKSRTAQLPAMLMVRAVKTPTQQFAGVIVAVVHLERLQGLLASARLGPNGAATMRTTELHLIARSSQQPFRVDETSTAKVSEQFRQAVAQSPTGGVFRAVTAIDGVDRVSAYHRLADYPIYVAVGQATEDFLVAWRNTALWAGAYLVLILGASVAVYRMATAKLKEQERARRLFDEAPCGYHTLDAEGRYLTVNATELRWLGCSREEVVGKLRPADFFTDAGRAQFATNFPLFKQTGQLEEMQVELVGRHGETRHVAISAKAVTDAQGRFLTSNSVMYDITELQSARLKLAARSAEQQAMLDSESVGMLRVRAGLIVWTNRGMDKIFGYERADWDKMPIARLFDDEAYYRETAARIAALAYGSGTFREDQHLLRKDGSRVWVDVSTVKSSPAAPESFTIVKDISDRKKAEATRLETVELEAQNVALLEAGRLKDEFLANMSHELRTPLNAVIGFSQILQMAKVGADTPKHANYIRQIGESGQHLLQLVQTMLDFAKTASGKLTFSPELVSVQAALDEVVAMLEPKRLAAGVEIEVAVEDGLSSVENDSLRLRQMVLNLAGNAVKFSRPGGTVSLRARGIDDKQWCVEVEDHGIGISEEGVKRLFGRFVQLSSGNTKAYGGTGLGLSLVRMIARAQGGNVAVRSELGMGSTFTLVLPRMLAERLPQQAVHSVES
jgi:PAS domain S-box-containing protein